MCTSGNLARRSGSKGFADASHAAEVLRLTDFLDECNLDDLPVSQPAAADAVTTLADTIPQIPTIASFNVESSDSPERLRTGSKGSQKPQWQSILAKAFERKPRRSDPEDDFHKLLSSLRVIPPTRHVVRGPAPENRLERLRLAAESPGETSGVPASERGMLWAESVGNQLRLTEAEFSRLCRRSRRLRSELQMKAANYPTGSDEVFRHV